MLSATDNRRPPALEDLESNLRGEWGVQVTLTEIDTKSRTVTVRAATYLDYILARVELKLHGLTAIRPVS